MTRDYCKAIEEKLRFLSEMCHAESRNMRKAGELERSDKCHKHPNSPRYLEQNSYSMKMIRSGPSYSGSGFGV